MSRLLFLFVKFFFSPVPSSLFITIFFSLLTVTVLFIALHYLERLVLLMRNHLCSGTLLRFLMQIYMQIINKNYNETKLIQNEKKKKKWLAPFRAPVISVTQWNLFKFRWLRKSHISWKTNCSLCESSFIKFFAEIKFTLDASTGNEKLLNLKEEIV